MDNFGLTILIIVMTTLVASYIKRISKDKCMKNFEGYFVDLELHDGTIFNGKLEVENTGLEIIFREHRTEQGINKMSYILYKDEYPMLHAIIRYHDDLTERGKMRRTAELNKTYHPNLLRRARRKMNNFFKLIKDSLLEIANTLSGKIKTTSQGAMLAQNEKYTTKLNQELINTLDASYDPLLEKYIGNIVVFHILIGDGIRIFSGILKEYTQNYVELLDVNYSGERLCDLVLPRRICHVRGLGESEKSYSIFSSDFSIKNYKKYFHKINTKKK